MSDDFALGLYMFGKHPSQLAAKEAQRRTDIDLAQYIEQQQERTKQEAAAGKAAAYAVEADPNLLKIIGMDKAAFKNLGASEQAAAVTGALRGQILREEQAKRQREAQTREAFRQAMANQTLSPLGGNRPDVNWSEAARNAIYETSARTGNPDLLRGLRDVEAGESRNIMPVATKVGGRDLLVNPNSGAFQDITQPTAPQIPKGMEALGAEQDESGNFKIRYGFPKAEGKALTQAEVAGLAALNQASSDLDTLENIYKDLGPDYGGPVSARAKSWAMGGQNPNIAALENAITAATPNLARGVFREVGVLTDQDVARYKQLLPSPTDTQEVRTRKIKQLRERIAQGRKEVVTSLKAAGRDVSEFSSGGDAPAATRFDTEAAARSSGAKAGDVVELYDPKTATYRKARLK